MRSQFFVCFTLLFILQSCGVLTSEQAQPDNRPNPDTANEIAPTSPATNTAIAPKVEPVTTEPDTTLETEQFSREVLYSLLTAEIAGARQQYNITLRQYIKAASITKDVGIIARATRLAQYFRNGNQALNMGTLWLEQEPNNIEAHTIVASAYVDKRQPLEALDHAESILALLTKETRKQAANNTQQTSTVNGLQSVEIPQPNIKQRAAILETIANFSRTLDLETREALISRYHTLDKRYPELSPVKVGLSVLYASKRDTDKAFAIVREAIAQDEDYLPAARQEINLLNANRQFDEALVRLKQQLEKTPNNARIRLLYARTLAQTDIKAAYEEFTILSDNAPKNLDIKFSKAIIALELRKLDDAQQTFTELLNRNYRPNTINYYLGNVAELKKETETAISYYLAVNGGNDFVAANTQAARLMADSNQLDDAQIHLQKLRNRSPNFRAEFFNTEADILEDQGQTQNAIDVLNVAINEYPDNINLRYTRSSLYEKTDRLSLMEDDLRHALNLEPENAAILNALGYFLTNRTERHQEAYMLIKKAIGIRPKDSAILDSMGWVLFKLGRFDEAIPYLRQAFEQFPDPEIASHLGEVLWVNGNQQEALQIWNKNLEENPDDTQIPAVMRRLNAQP